MFNTRSVNTAYYPRVLLRNLGAAASVEFRRQREHVPLPIETSGATSTVLVLHHTVAEGNRFRAGAETSSWLVLFPGLVAIVYSLNYLARDWSDAVTAVKVKELFLPFILTVVFLPCAVAVKYFSVWQTMLHMIEAGFDGNARLYPVARRRVIRACGTSLAKAQLFESGFRGRSADDEAAVDVVIGASKRSGVAAGESRQTRKCRSSSATAAAAVPR